MNVLFLAARFPWPPDRGDRLTTYHLLHALSRRHGVTLAAFRDGHEPADAGRSVQAACGRIESVMLTRAQSWAQAWLGLFSGVPSQVRFFRSREMMRLIEGLCRETRFDVIFAQTFRMAPFVRAIPHPARVLYLGDSHSLALRRSMPFQPWWRRPGVAWEGARVARYEVEVASDFRECWVLSQPDRDDFAARGCGNVAIVTHGVDERLFDLPLAAREGARVLFLGNLSVPHNIDAAAFLAREVWPRIRARLPHATLTVAGASPTRAVRGLAELPGVAVTGALPDLLPLWQRCAVTIAPLRFSTGIQNKVLEPMAAGVPVVTTPQVAEGIGAAAGAHVLIGTDAESLARAAVEILEDPAAQQPMVARARAFVRERFSWETAVRRLEAVAGESR